MVHTSNSRQRGAVLAGSPPFKLFSTCSQPHSFLFQTGQFRQDHPCGHILILISALCAVIWVIRYQGQYPFRFFQRHTFISVLDMCDSPCSVIHSLHRPVPLKPLIKVQGVRQQERHLVDGSPFLGIVQSDSGLEQTPD